jgi:signal transduction histidine kinase
MPSTQINILMIDDDEEDFMIVRDIIEDLQNGYKIEWVSSYQEGLADIAAKKHDVYLVDYKLGAHTGLELISEAVAMGCEVPLIILTGQKSIEIDRKAMEAGASDYIVKGTISGQMLESSIRYAVANARHRKEMKDLNAELEERVKKRTWELEEAMRDLERSKQELWEAKGIAEKAAQQAEEASNAKTQFLSNMSHEIRTPMNAIVGFTKVVLRTNLDQKQKEYLNAIKVSGESLIVLINDILDLAKVEAGKMTFEKVPFQFRADINAMLNLFENKIQEKDLVYERYIDPDIPEVLKGDQIRLNQIILNLVSNAAKFTTKGKVSVRVEIVNQESDFVEIRFSVQDTGIGIPEDKLSTIFEKFQQATSSTARIFGGTGLGLAIVKQLVELQGGRIEVKSKTGEGSVFSVTLKFDKADEAEEKENDSDLGTELNNPGFKAKVLLVEDIPLNQLLLKTILDEFGFEQATAENGQVAIDKLKQEEYDIILMDLQMPVLNGFETTDYIRKEMKSSIPIIALTADVTTVDIEKCRAAGMNDYIAKPIDDKLLYDKILKYLKKNNPKKTSESQGAVSEAEKFIHPDHLFKINVEVPDILKEKNLQETHNTK